VLGGCTFVVVLPTPQPHARIDPSIVRNDPNAILGGYLAAAPDSPSSCADVGPRLPPSIVGSENWSKISI